MNSGRLVVGKVSLQVEYYPVSPATPPAEVDTVVVNLATTALFKAESIGGKSTVNKFREA